MDEQEFLEFKELSRQLEALVEGRHGIIALNALAFCMAQVVLDTVKKESQVDIVEGFLGTMKEFLRHEERKSKFH